MAKKKVLVINLGWEQEPLLKELSKRNVELYGIHYDENYYQKVRYHDILITDLRELPKILKYADKIKPDAVISDQCDYSYFAQALICEKFNLPGPGIKEAQIATNKYLQRIKAVENNFLNPDFKLCFSISDIIEFTNDNNFPIMIKSVDNRGSFGVNKVSRKNQIPSAFFDAIINSHSRNVLSEKFISGTHLTVDGYIFPNGPKALAVASKEKLKVKDSIIDGEIVYPANISDELYKKAAKTLEEIAEKFGFKFGFLHGEFILTEKGDIYLTEIANRGGGVYTSEIIVPNYTGFDIVNYYINDALGEPNNTIDLRLMQKNPTMLKFFAFDTNKEGFVKSINGIESIDKDSNVLSLKMMIRKGDLLKKITNGAERHGLIIYTSGTVKQLQLNVKNILKNMEVEIEKD